MSSKNKKPRTEATVVPPQKRAIPRVNNENFNPDQQAAPSNSLFQSILHSKTLLTKVSIDRIVNAWLDKLANSKLDGVCEMVNFLIWSAQGVCYSSASGRRNPMEISRLDFQNNIENGERESVELVAEFVAKCKDIGNSNDFVTCPIQEAACFRILGSNNKTGLTSNNNQRILQNFEHFFKSLAVSLPRNDVLVEVIPILIPWLKALTNTSVSHLVSLRFVSTMASLCFLEGLMIVSNGQADDEEATTTLTGQLEVFRQQLSTIEKGHRTSIVGDKTTRLRDLKAKISTTEKMLSSFNSASEEFAKILVPNRSKDSNVYIRCQVIKHLSKFGMVCFQYLKETWTCYYHFALNDYDPLVRQTSLTCLFDLFANQTVRKKLLATDLSTHIKPRVVGRCFDSEPAVMTCAIKLATLMAKIICIESDEEVCFLDDEDYQQISNLVWHPNSLVSTEASTFVNLHVLIDPGLIDPEKLIDELGEGVEEKSGTMLKKFKQVEDETKILMGAEFINQYSDGNIHQLSGRFVRAIFDRSSCLQKWSVYMDLIFHGEGGNVGKTGARSVRSGASSSHRTVDAGARSALLAMLDASIRLVEDPSKIDLGQHLLPLIEMFKCNPSGDLQMVLSIIRHLKPRTFVKPVIEALTSLFLEEGEENVDLLHLLADCLFELDQGETLNGVIAPKLYTNCREVMSSSNDISKQLVGIVCKIGVACKYVVTLDSQSDDFSTTLLNLVEVALHGGSLDQLSSNLVLFGLTSVVLSNLRQTPSDDTTSNLLDLIASSILDGGNCTSNVKLIGFVSFLDLSKDHTISSKQIRILCRYFSKVLVDAENAFMNEGNNLQKQFVTPMTGSATPMTSSSGGKNNSLSTISNNDSLSTLSQVLYWASKREDEVIDLISVAKFSIESFASQVYNKQVFVGPLASTLVSHIHSNVPVIRLYVGNYLREVRRISHCGDVNFTDVICSLEDFWKLQLVAVQMSFADAGVNFARDVATYCMQRVGVKLLQGRDEFFKTIKMGINWIKVDTKTRIPFIKALEPWISKNFLSREQGRELAGMLKTTDKLIDPIASDFVRKCAKAPVPTFRASVVEVNDAPMAIEDLPDVEMELEAPEPPRIVVSTQVSQEIPVPVDEETDGLQEKSVKPGDKTLESTHPVGKTQESTHAVGRTQESTHAVGKTLESTHAVGRTQESTQAVGRTLSTQALGKTQESTQAVGRTLSTQALGKTQEQGTQSTVQLQDGSEY